MSEPDAKFMALLVKLRQKGILSLEDVADIESDADRFDTYLWGGNPG
jgi:hypothetical protein